MPGLPFPNCLEPLRKLTVPVGTVLPLPLTVAFKVKAVPEEIVFVDAARLVVDWAATTTVTDTAAEVLDRKLELPKYLAVKTIRQPIARDFVESIATPEAFGETPFPAAWSHSGS